MYAVTSRDTETGKLTTTEHPDEFAAVRAWGLAALYINTEPVDCVPWPNWSQYRDGLGYRHWMTGVTRQEWYARRSSMS